MSIIKVPTSFASSSYFNPVICNVPFANTFTFTLRKPQYLNLSVA